VKKLGILVIALVAFVAFASAPVSACDGNKTTKTTSAEKSCSAKQTAQMASAHGKMCDAKDAQACSVANMEACAKLMGMTKEECQEVCGENAKFSMATIDIKGMTCGGCENSVKTALMKIEGVQNVAAISHEKELAVVVFDPKVATEATLTKTVTDKGYQAQIVPAVAKLNEIEAKTTKVNSTDKKACSKTCTKAEKAACSAEKKTDNNGGGI
jgi:copper chaperone